MNQEVKVVPDSESNQGHGDFQSPCCEYSGSEVNILAGFRSVSDWLHTLKSVLYENFTSYIH